MRDGNEPFIRKRTIIAIFITLTVFILFILTKPMLVSFDIDGNDEIVTQVQLNKKDNDEFIKTKKASAKLDIQDSAHVNLFVENSRSPKRIRLILSELEKGNTFTISNIIISYYNNIFCRYRSRIYF